MGSLSLNEMLAPSNEMLEINEKNKQELENANIRVNSAQARVSSCYNVVYHSQQALAQAQRARDEYIENMRRNQEDGDEPIFISDSYDIEIQLAEAQLEESEELLRLAQDACIEAQIARDRAEEALKESTGHLFYLKSELNDLMKKYAGQLLAIQDLLGTPKGHLAAPLEKALRDGYDRTSELRLRILRSLGITEADIQPVHTKGPLAKRMVGGDTSKVSSDHIENFHSEAKNAYSHLPDSSENQYGGRAVNSEQRENDPESEISRLSQLDKSILEIFACTSSGTAQRIQALHNAYADTPYEILSIIEKYIGSLRAVSHTEYVLNKNGEWVLEGSHYSPETRSIHMQEHLSAQAYADIFQHELGHFIDDMLGQCSSGLEFMRALASDIRSFDIRTPDGKIKLADMLDDAFNTGAAYDRNVSDILSALFRNNPYIIKRFLGEGVAYYQHEDVYWEKTWRIPAEIFANMFAIESAQYRVSVNFAERWFPGITEAFRRRIHDELG